MHPGKYFFVMRHSSLRKMLNLLLLILEMRASKTILRSMPVSLNVDITNNCNLHCNNCLAEQNRDSFPPGYMGYPEFKRIIDNLGGYLFSVNLYLWGEPFLNRDVFRMIRYADRMGIYTLLSSNLNIFSREYAERLIGSGLRELMVNIPSPDSEVYMQYTKSGSLETVKKNIRLISNIKKDKRSSRPLVKLLLITSSENYSDMITRRSELEPLGADQAVMQMMDPVDIDWLKQKRLLNNWLKRWNGPGRKCSWLWQRMVINYNGTTEPCCRVYYKFRNTLTPDIRDIRNSREMIDLRKGFLQNRHDIICSNCDILRQYHRG
jgi:MoaA/NifB/PqqE/SkfB family radical SAM enzyme